MTQSSSPEPMALVATRYHQSLTAEAQAYLAARGLGEHAATFHRIGSVVDPIGEHEKFEGMLSIPYFAASGQVLGWKFRRLDDGKPKYMQPAGQRQRLYNVVALIERSPVVGIAEGEPDTWTAHAECGIPTVGVPGVDAWSAKDHRHWPKLFEGFRRVVVFADNDVKPDGKNPGMDLARHILDDVEHAQLVELPAGEDLNSFYVKHGRQAVRDLAGLTS